VSLLLFFCLISLTQPRATGRYPLICGKYQSLCKGDCLAFDLLHTSRYCWCVLCRPGGNAQKMDITWLVLCNEVTDDNPFLSLCREIQVTNIY
jgi:hypothetical protein